MIIGELYKVNLNFFLTDSLQAGRNFLARSQLRSLRNLSLLPPLSRDELLNSLLENNKLTPTESEACYEILEAWVTYSVRGFIKPLQLAGEDWRKYNEWRNLESTDDFYGCYFPNGDITARGLALRMEAGVCKNAE